MLADLTRDREDRTNRENHQHTACLEVPRSSVSDKCQEKDASTPQLGMTVKFEATTSSQFVSSSSSSPVLAPIPREYPKGEPAAQFVVPKFIEEFLDPDHALHEVPGGLSSPVQHPCAPFSDQSDAPRIGTVVDCEQSEASTQEIPPSVDEESDSDNLSDSTEPLLEVPVFSSDDNTNSLPLLSPKPPIGLRTPIRAIEDFVTSVELNLESDISHIHLNSEKDATAKTDVRKEGDNLYRDFVAGEFGLRSKIRSRSESVESSNRPAEDTYRNENELGGEKLGLKVTKNKRQPVRPATPQQQSGTGSASVDLSAAVMSTSTPKIRCAMCREKHTRCQYDDLSLGCRRCASLNIESDIASRFLKCSEKSGSSMGKFLSGAITSGITLTEPALDVTNDTTLGPAQQGQSPGYEEEKLQIEENMTDVVAQEESLIADDCNPGSKQAPKRQRHHSIENATEDAPAGKRKKVRVFENHEERPEGPYPTKSHPRHRDGPKREFSHSLSQFGLDVNIKREIVNQAQFATGVTFLIELDTEGTNESSRSTTKAADKNHQTRTDSRFLSDSSASSSRDDDVEEDDARWLAEQEQLLVNDLTETQSEPFHCEKLSRCDTGQHHVGSEHQSVRDSTEDGSSSKCGNRGNAGSDQQSVSGSTEDAGVSSQRENGRNDALITDQDVEEREKLVPFVAVELSHDLTDHERDLPLIADVAKRSKLIPENKLTVQRLEHSTIPVTRITSFENFTALESSDLTSPHRTTFSWTDLELRAQLLEQNPPLQGSEILGEDNWMKDESPLISIDLEPDVLDFPDYVNKIGRRGLEERNMHDHQTSPTDEGSTQPPGIGDVPFPQQGSNTVQAVLTVSEELPPVVTTRQNNNDTVKHSNSRRHKSRRAHTLPMNVFPTALLASYEAWNVFENPIEFFRKATKDMQEWAQLGSVDMKRPPELSETLSTETDSIRDFDMSKCLFDPSVVTERQARTRIFVRALNQAVLITAKQDDEVLTALYHKLQPLESKTDDDTFLRLELESTKRPDGAPVYKMITDYVIDPCYLEWARENGVLVKIPRGHKGIAQ
ncbi:hypothetical protein HDU93_002348 [Gonapodya sp. JEL0774]|nr:hypothetical protein HDU93_002348 [Gonapodya sp. JEL0774]